MKCQDMIICYCLLILASAASSQHIQHVNCPFQYLYHFGDGFTDVGKSIHVPSRTPNPAARLPYGRSSPGWPTGRWSDGLNDFDFAERATRMETAFLFLGDIEGNDIGYALTQGKSIEEVQTYVPLITRAQIRVARTILIEPALRTLGCTRSVNSTTSNLSASV
ncbi:hypothetical protein BUALT_Bualt12G0137500 [Buddleja alternifolia]|uniref:GDSL esterase/lipase n=1 Tax=Buddleja alternifolia TaxID=168488 RepID=A0AAV6X1P1_9LAMI|nr:hypothetical protein BUALT_Bualt12G0137500 [Buddleja alternifolia]